MTQIKPPPGAGHGIDVDHEDTGTVTKPRLYQPIRQPMPIVDRQFEIEFLDSGAEALAFTFGRSAMATRASTLLRISYAI